MMSFATVDTNATRSAWSTVVKRSTSRVGELGVRARRTGSTSTPGRLRRRSDERVGVAGQIGRRCAAPPSAARRPLPSAPGSAALDSRCPRREYPVAVGYLARPRGSRLGAGVTAGVTRSRPAPGARMSDVDCGTARADREPSVRHGTCCSRTARTTTARTATFRWPRLERVQLGDGTGSTRWPPSAPSRPALWVVEDGRHRRAADLSPSWRARSTPARRLARRRRGRPRRQGAADARQPGRAVGDDAGLHPARRRDDPGDHAAGAGRPARPGRPRAGRGTSSRAPRTPREFADVPGDWTRIAVGERRRTAGCPTATAEIFDGEFAAGGATRGRRDPAALLHLGHDGAAQARRAHPRVVPGRAPVDDVLDRAAAGRRAPQHLVAGMGEARLEQRLRAVERRGDDRHRQPAAFDAAEPARGDGAGGRDDVLRAADGVADARAGRPGRVPRPDPAARGASAPASR